MIQFFTKLQFFPTGEETEADSWLRDRVYCELLGMIGVLHIWNDRILELGTGDAGQWSPSHQTQEPSA